MVRSCVFFWLRVCMYNVPFCSTRRVHWLGEKIGCRKVIDYKVITDIPFFDAFVSFLPSPFSVSLIF